MKVTPKKDPAYYAGYATGVAFSVVVLAGAIRLVGWMFGL